MSVDKVRELCYEELEMCCQTLCNKQDVWNYIKQLEDEIERLKGQDDNKNTCEPTHHSFKCERK